MNNLHTTNSTPSVHEGVRVILNQQIFISTYLLKNTYKNKYSDGYSNGHKTSDGKKMHY